MFRPWLFLPAKLAHDLAPLGLQILASGREVTVEKWQPFDWRGLHFQNRLGLAGGVDKNAEQIEDWWTFGPGFIEVGTVTPKPQAANPGKILFRNTERLAVCNRMGFPNHGVRAVRENLKDLPPERPTPVFVNIGRNRSTSNADAAQDYVTCLTEIGELADAFIINISSPNTSGLRELFLEQNLLPFLRAIEAARTALKRHVPLLLKLSPDLELAELRRIVLTALEVGFEGFVATNTTLERKPGLDFPNEGGVSGQPLTERSELVLRELIATLGPRRKDALIVSAGGLLTPQDVERRLQLGADLVQVYTALVFTGPWFFRQVARHFQA